MKKKAISVLLAGLMGLSLLAGCGGSNSGENSSSKADANTSAAGSEDNSKGEDITISLWTVFTGSDGDVLREIIDNYNETNQDGITVEIDIMDNDTLQSKLPSAVTSGTGPSFVLVGIEYIQEYAENGMIEPIDDFWEATGTNEDNYYENVVAKSYVDGTLYGVPMQYNLQYLYYNKDLFEEAGIDSVPSTFDELAEDARALTDKNAGRYGLAMPSDFGYYVQYLWGNGGDVIDTSTGEVLLDSQENIDTLTWLQELAGDVSPAGLTSADADTMFQAGQLAMLISGPWNINVLNGLGMNYGIAAMPAGSAGAYSAEGGCSYMVRREQTRRQRKRYTNLWPTG